MFPNNRELMLFELGSFESFNFIEQHYFRRDDLGFYFLTKREVECGMAFNTWLRFKRHAPYEVWHFIPETTGTFYHILSDTVKFFKLDLNFIPSNSAPILLLHVPCSGLMNTLVLYQSLIDLTTDKSPSLSLEASSKPPVDLVVNINWKNSSATDRKAKWTGQRSPFWQSHPPGCQRELGASTKPQVPKSAQTCIKEQPKVPLHTLIQA